MEDLLLCEGGSEAELATVSSAGEDSSNANQQSFIDESLTEVNLPSTSEINAESNNFASKNLNSDAFSQLSLLYEKFNMQCSEIDRLEKQNSEYREHLLKSIKEKEQADEKLRTNQRESSAKFEELERKLLEFEYQLKACKDRSSARETYHNQYISDMSAKMNDNIAQFQKKLEQAEKEKNNAVIKYATREAEILRLRNDCEKLKGKITQLELQIEMLRNSNDYGNVERLELSVKEYANHLEEEKKAKASAEAELNLALKRIETGQITISELRSTVEKLKKQISEEISEKIVIRDDHKKLIMQLHTLEKQKEEVEGSAKKINDNKEELYRNVLEELSRLRERNATLTSQMESQIRENAKLINEYQNSTDELNCLKVARQNDLEKLQVLEGVESKVLSYVKRVEKAEKLAGDAILEKEQAEQEANECRKQAERMLEITQQLSEKNSFLSSQCEVFRSQIFELNKNLLEIQANLRQKSNKLEEVERELELQHASFSAEITSLRSMLDEKIVKVQELTRELDETRNEKEVIKRKNTSALKELRAELQYLRKLQAENAQRKPIDNESEMTLSVSANGEIHSSRASSISSADIGNRPPAHSSLEDCSSNIQQQMIEKIVQLQRQLARKQNKIDFLEEHVRQCTEELRKKTKIIQNYALREEASLLLPEDDLTKLLEICDFMEVPMKKNGGIPLFGNIFTNADRKSELELAIELNSRLQAVLEDILHKNITLKNNIDTLGEEISRLSRENRQLALANAS